MNRMFSFSLDYYNKQVIPRIMEKYNMNQMDAARSFLTSETHSMLENAYDDIDCLVATGRHLVYG